MPNDKMVSFNVSDMLLAKIKEQAKREGKNVSEFLRDTLTDLLQDIVIAA